MTSAQERPAARRGLAWEERSLLSDYAGLRWWGAVCVALGLTAVGIFADIQRLNRLGIVFQACYFLGCLLAVVAVQRRGLFGPMVQPPLILALMLPAVVLLAGSTPTDGGTAAAALAVGTPLINGFPTMAVTTMATVAVGSLRLFTQRRPATEDSPATRTADAGPEAEDQPPIRQRAPEQPRRVPAEPAAARPPARPVRGPDPEPLTEPVPRVTDPAPEPRDDADRSGRRRPPPPESPAPC